ncbi:glycosyltransferase [Actinomadura sp. 7K507]|uniref:glycosyltransferase n=1 Tax=Actinomadura sp. 7K507 TaxID=2530365 RepID=UPI001048533B|nr:glycosyltransferase [Actinomadura sp. 7K507]TDC97486.1 glycosyltransferase family 1 protein [Actinomadura sp. 7K507]
MIRVLVDGRVVGSDGIGRYTRQLIDALCRSSLTDVRITVLEPTGTPRYTRAEGTELAVAAQKCGANVVHLLDYRIPVERLDVPILITIHDVFRATRPRLCYSDTDFADRFGVASLKDLKELTTAIMGSHPGPGAGLTSSASAHRRFYRAMLEFACTQAQGVIVPTRTVGDQLRSLVGFTAGLTVSHYGVDHLESNDDDRSPVAGLTKRYLLYVGQARSHKALPRLCAAYLASNAHDLGVPFVFAGRDFTDSTHHAKAVRSELGNAAILLGEIDDSTLARLYCNASALVHLAEYEGFGFTPLEALTLGTRVVVNDLDVFRETLADHAFYCRTGSTEEIGALLNRLLWTSDDPSQREIRALWAGRYTWKAHVDDLLSVYRKVGQ